MIERYLLHVDIDIDKTKMLKNVAGAYVRYDDVKPLIAPPWKAECPDCIKSSEGESTGVQAEKCSCGGFLVGCPYCGGPEGDGNSVHYCDTCFGTGVIYKYYTPTEWRQWYLDNGLPDPGEWVGAVWVRIHAHDGIRAWHLKQQNDVYDWIASANDWISTTPYAGKWEYEVLLSYGNVPAPPNDYRHEVQK